MKDVKNLFVELHRGRNLQRLSKDNIHINAILKLNLFQV